MSDPLERLRGSSDASVPSVDVIRSRAHRIQRRRYVAVASSAAIVVVLAGVGLFVRTNPSSTKQRQTSSNTAAQAFAPVATAPVPAAGGASGSSAGALEKSAATSAPLAGGYAASAPGPANDSTSQGALVAKLVVKTHGGGADFTLSVCNPSASSTSRTFPNTDRYDFQVSRNGKVVWAYSHGHMHGDIVGSETWKAHECKTWTYSWDGKQDSGTPSAPGSYSVVGIMTSYSPQLRTQPQNFCVYVC